MQHYGDTARTLVMLRIANGSVELETLESLCLLSYSSFLGTSPVHYRNFQQIAHHCQMETFLLVGSISDWPFSFAAQQCLMFIQHMASNAPLLSGNADSSGASRHWNRPTVRLTASSACRLMYYVLSFSRRATNKLRRTLNQNRHLSRPIISVALIPVTLAFGVYPYTSAGSGVGSGLTSLTAHKVV